MFGAKSRIKSGWQFAAPMAQRFATEPSFEISGATGTNRAPIPQKLSPVMSQGEMSEPRPLQRVVELSPIGHSPHFQSHLFNFLTF